MRTRIAQIRMVEMEATDVEEFRAVRSRVQSALHHLWTKYVKTPGYDKNEWKELSNAISVLEIIARKTTGSDTV